MTAQNVAVRRVGTAVLVLAVVLAACDKTQGAPLQGPAADVAREAVAILAPNAPVADLPFEDAIARLDFAKAYGARGDEILAQLRKTRTAVEAKVSSSATGGPRLASLLPVVGNFSIAAFRYDFGFVLEEITRAGGSRPFPPRQFSANEAGKDTFTTTTIAVTEGFNATGSVVTGTVRWTYTTITIDTSPTGGGATIFHLIDDRDLVGTIDVCPDGGGGVPATLKAKSKIVIEAAGATTTRTTDGSSSFRGSVNDQASLTGVSQQSRVETSWQSASGNGGYASTTSATWNANSGGINDLADGSFRTDITSSGTATAAEVAKSVGWDTALSIFAVEEAYQQARNLWQKGRCVIVAVQEYKAETPIKIEEQQTSQHTEEVEVSSDTKFTVGLRHRFAGGSLNKLTNADLTSGKEKLTPNKIESGAGELTYKAADEEDKEAKALLRSTSNRGIGTLVLTFKTGGKLTLSVRGTQEIGPPSATLRSTISIGPAEFAKKDEKTFEATAPFSATSVLIPADPDCPDLKITHSGTLVFTAKVEKRGEQSFWVVSYGPGGNSTVVGSGCDEEVTKSLAVGGGFAAGLFLGNVGDIVIPIEGGTVQLSGSRGTGRASGTATATVKK